MGDDARVKANEPTKSDGEASSSSDARPHGTVLPAHAIDDGAAGDGVAFFEGGDGREEARGDIERNG